MADGTVWRFGYGSNMSVANLKQKKNLNVLEHHAGVVRDIKLSFCLEGIHYVDPAFACVLKAPGDEVHGVAFRIPAMEAEGLDRQEGGYNVEFVPFKPYEGTSSFEVGLYMPKPGRLNESYTGLPSLRYLRLLREGAASANLSAEYQARLAALPHYVTPGEVRAKTEALVAAFEASEKCAVLWTAAELSKHDGTTEDKTSHTESMGYVIKCPRPPFGSWKGHSITRRNLLHFRGQSVDTEDIRPGQPGFTPLPKLSECTDEEIEWLKQNLDCLLAREGAVIVGRLKEFVDSQ